MTALALDLIALLRQRQTVDLNNIVEHPRKHFHDFAERIPVEARVLGERIDDKTREVD